MKVLIVSAVFPPEPLVSAQTSHQLAKALVGLGHQVTVIAPFPHRPQGKLYQGYQLRPAMLEEHPAGVRIIRCFSTMSQTSSLLSRFLENFTFGLSSTVVILLLNKFDVVYFNTWPIFACSLGLAAAKIRGSQTVLSIQDVYPESLVVQKRIKQNGLVCAVLKWMDRLISQSVDAVVLISSTFKQLYVGDRGLSDEKIRVIPNWIDPARVDINVETETFRRQKGIREDEFLGVYAGNVGVASGVCEFLEILSSLEIERMFMILIAGEGSQTQEAMRLAFRLHNPRVLFHSPWPEGETSVVLRAADFFILPTLPDQLHSSVPSKILYYMLAAKPILALVEKESELAEIIREAECGWVLSHEEVEDLPVLIRRMANTSRSKLRRLGLNGRRYVLDHNLSSTCIPRLVSVLLEDQRQ